MAAKGVLTAGWVFLVVSCLWATSDSNVSSGFSVSESNSCLPEPSIPRWQVWNFWQVLQPGMEPEKATELLGEPLETEDTETVCLWYYQERPQRLASGAIQRPRYGLLNFKKTTIGEQEVVVLKNWKPPDWNQVRSYTALEYEAEQEKLRKLREEALLRQQQAEEKRRLEEERLRQQELIRQQQLERQRQMQAQQAAAEREKTFSLANIPRTYWYAAGGVLVGLIVAVIFIKKPFMD